MEGLTPHKYTVKYDEKAIKKLSDSILSFAENDRSAHFATWARKQKKNPSWINWLVSAYPEFKQAYADAKALMSAKLLNSSIYQDDPKFNAVHAMSYLPVYDKDLRAFLEFKSNLSKNSDEAMQATADQFVKAIRESTLLDLLKQDPSKK